MDNKLSNGFNSLFTAAKNIANGVDQYVTDEVKDERLKLCEGCPSLVKSTKQCGECWCFVQLKTKLKQEKCPLDKWKSIE